MSEHGDPLPNIVDAIAAARGSGHSWRAIKSSFFDACAEVVKLDVAEPITRRRIDDAAIEDSHMGLLGWMMRHCGDLDPNCKNDQHVARQRLNRARAKSRTDVHSSVRE